MNMPVLSVERSPSNIVRCFLRTIRTALVCNERRRDDTRQKSIEQLVTHYGVLVERAPDELNFVHLSIQEYLAAKSIARESSDDQLRLVVRCLVKFSLA